MMPKYRSKPVIKEAIKWDGNLTSIEHFNIPEVHQELGCDNLYIPTLEGVMRCEVGDYIVRGLKGEFYPVKSDVFELSYELVNDDA